MFLFGGRLVYDHLANKFLGAYVTFSRKSASKRSEMCSTPAYNILDLVLHEALNQLIGTEYFIKPSGTDFHRCQRPRFRSRRIKQVIVNHCIPDLLVPHRDDLRISHPTTAPVARHCSVHVRTAIMVYCSLGNLGSSASHHFETPFCLWHGSGTLLESAREPKNHLF